MTALRRYIARYSWPRPLAAAAILCAAAATGGCMTSPGREYYTAHTSQRIEPGPAANDDVAAAFGLDRFAQPGPAVATDR